MPAIVIRDYTWRQTSELVILHVPVAGHPKKLDLFVSDNYVKASFPPFILELFLWSEVVEEKSKCIVTNREAILSLQKAEVGLEWPVLEVQNIGNEIKRGRRSRALERSQAAAEERAKTKSEKRQQLQRDAVKAQINIETAMLNKIDAMRDAHRKEAMQDLENWRSTVELPILQSVEGKIQENQKAYKPPLKWFKDKDGDVKSRPLTEEEILNNTECVRSIESKEVKSLEWRKSEIDNTSKGADDNAPHNNTVIESRLEEHNSTDNEINVEESTIKKTSEKFPDPADESSCSEVSESDNNECSIKEMDEKTLQKYYEKKKNERSRHGLIDRLLKGKLRRNNSIFDESEKSVPLPRKNSTINVTFSERAFPTPARESSHLQEQEWLQKQAEARRKTGFVVEDLRPEEREPQWLKDKGDDFFKVGNYLAAISAYTHGIGISDRMASLYVNRSAAHYALGNYYRCTEDCSKALELMEPKCEGNRESRARCHARRGAALCKLSSPQHGIPELQAALELAPDNESIKRDLLAAKQYFDIRD